MKLQFKDPEWPEELSRLLATIQESTGVFCVIAGGAVRDGILGGPVRDIDIYVDQSEFNVVSNLLYGATDAWDEHDRNLTVFQEGDTEYDHQYIWVQKEDDLSAAMQVEFPKLRDYPINLIGVYAQAYGGMIDGKSITALFNLTTSQAWIEFDGDGYSLGYSDMFRVSKDAQLCRILRTEWGRAGTVRTVTKFLEKYPSFAADIPNYGIYREGEWEAGLSAWLDNEGAD